MPGYDLTDAAQVARPEAAAAHKLVGEPLEQAEVDRCSTPRHAQPSVALTGH